MPRSGKVATTVRLRAREASEVDVSYVVFACLATPGHLRQVLLCRRWKLSMASLEETGLAVQFRMDEISQSPFGRSSERCRCGWFR